MGTDFGSMAERQHQMWQAEELALSRKTAPGPPLDRCHCGAFAPYARNNLRHAPEAAEHFCRRHAPPDLRGRADAFDL